MDKKIPSKPKPTVATTAQLVDHYTRQLPAYQAAVQALPADKRRGELDLSRLAYNELNDTAVVMTLQETGPEAGEEITREELVELIRRQNHRLGRHIKARSHELLLEKIRDDEGNLVLADGRYTVGHTYQAILEILATEFPEASTSVACLRWYVVHMRSDARDEGSPWPDLPQKRPRSSSKKAVAKEVV